MDSSRVEQVSDSNIGPGLPPASTIHWIDLGVVVGRSSGRTDRLNQSVERLIRLDDAVVLGTAVVLDLLQSQDVGTSQVIDDHQPEFPKALLAVRRIQVLDVVGGKGQAAATASQPASSYLPSSTRHLGEGLRRNQAIRSKSVVQDTHDLAIEAITDRHRRSSSDSKRVNDQALRIHLTGP